MRWLQLGGLTFWTRHQKPWKDIEFERYKADMEKVIEVNGDVADKQAPVTDTKPQSTVAANYVECQDYVEIGKYCFAFNFNGY